MTDGDVTFSPLNQNPPFPTPEELQAKLSEFMKSNFGDKVSFATFAQPERAEVGEDEKSAKQLDDQFVYPDRYMNCDLVLRHYVNPVRHKFWTTLARRGFL